MPRSTGPWTTQKRDEEWTLGRISSSIEPAVKIVVLEEAQRRFEAEDTWWRENRLALGDEWAAPAQNARMKSVPSWWQLVHTGG